MKRVYGLLFTIGLVFVSIRSVQAQIVVRDIGSLLEEGKIRFIEVRGRGSVGGLSLDAAIENLTDQKLFISIFFEKPIYFTSRQTDGQDMIAMLVAYHDGTYIQKDIQKYIELPPLQYEKVRFFAFGTSFAIPNESNTFSVGELPSEHELLLETIAQYIKKDPHEVNGRAAQIALWKAEGYDKIIKLDTTIEEEKIANMLLNNTVP